MDKYFIKNFRTRWKMIKRILRGRQVVVISTKKGEGITYDYDTKDLKSLKEIIAKVNNQLI